LTLGNWQGGLWGSPSRGQGQQVAILPESSSRTTTSIGSIPPPRPSPAPGEGGKTDWAAPAAKRGAALLRSVRSSNRPRVNLKKCESVAFIQCYCITKETEQSDSGNRPEVRWQSEIVWPISGISCRADKRKDDSHFWQRLSPETSCMGG